jgi:hypothetical protein
VSKAFEAEMQRALEADGEKLRQLTGEDHGPWDLTIVECTACGGEGRIIINHGVGYDRHTGYFPDERDHGPCPYCDGTGGEIITTQPIEIDDLDDPIGDGK